MPKRDWYHCDLCGADDYTDANPFVECRIPRPSDKTDMCCVIAGHLNCLSPMPADRLPSIAPFGGGTATPEQWEHWIENEGAAAGYQWIS
jgi:hypothetical protein